MKKILTLLIAALMFTGSSFAATSLGNAVKSAVKQDIASTKSAVKSDVSAVKNAIKQDINNQKQAQTSTAAAKKAEKIKQIDSKLAELNEQMKLVKEDKNITETERVLKIRTIQRQIDFYNNQKKALN